MKRFVSVLVLALFAVSAYGAQSGRPAMSNKIMTAPRYTASINQLNGMVMANNNAVTVDNTVAYNDGSATTAVAVTEEKEQIDMREAERNACINNNVGISNTFVWASRYSDTSNYASMNEDIKNPKNNVCFVRVELKSSDPKLSVSDIPAKYFMWGENIECGSWVNESDMEKRILDAKKGARIGGIVASTVGGAGVGVGAMELFGNKAIGGKVEGQKALSGMELYRSQLLVYKDKNPTEYRRVCDALRVLSSTEEAVNGIQHSEYITLLSACN